MNTIFLANRRTGVRFATLTGSLALTAALTGCGLGGNFAATTATPVTGANVIAGSVHGGLQAVQKATIQLYEVGAGGYGTPAKPILTSAVLSGQYGGFNITGLYTCDPGSYVYITASGGDAGAGTNKNLALMTALGSCSQLKTNAATTFIVINEVTTVAAAYALAQFSGGTTFGSTLSDTPGVNGVTAPADNFASSATNVQGVANAMAVAAVLAGPNTGTSPGNNRNASATVESYTVNTIADILSVCVNSNGGTSSATNCGKIFAATTPVGGTAPADTIQVALQLALHPGDANLLAGTPSGSTLDSFITAQPPYTPYVNTSIAGNTINDWTIGVSYNPTAAGSTILSASNAIAIDGFGNAWITGGNKAVVELAANGDPIQSGTTAGNYAVTSYNVGGAATNTVGGASPTSSFFGIALDPNNNAWASDYGSGYLFKITASGAQFGVNGESTTNANGGGGVAATSLFTGNANAHPIGIAFDGSNNLFSTLYGNGGVSPTGATGAVCGAFTAGTKNLVTFPYNTASATYGAIVYGSSAGSNQTFIAIDNGMSTNDQAGGTAITGSPFVWWFADASGGTETHGSVAGHYGYLYQANTQGGGTNPLGCNTALGSITSSSTGASASTTTRINQNANGGNTTDVFNNPWAVAFDNGNNIWTANQLPTDNNATFLTSFTKVTPNYGMTVTPANFQAATTFATYTAGGMLAAGMKPFAVVIDGAGNAYAPNLATKPIVAAVSNLGAALAPSTGFTGATYSPDGTSYELTRPTSTTTGAAFDLSGNLWLSASAPTLASAAGVVPPIAMVPATNVVQIVGLGAPVVTPMAAAVKTGTIGTRP